LNSSDPVEEWQRLNGLYAEMGDIELLELRAAEGDLTELAQGVLRDELKRRRLWDTPTPDELAVEAKDSDRDESGGLLEDLSLGGVTVREFDTVGEANLAGYVLDLAGIHAVTVDQSGKFDLRLPSVRVAPEDAQKAATILAQPISADVRGDYEAMQSLPDFEAPVCPRCSSGEGMLEAFEPMNQWLCGACGHRWQDPPPDE
jgi:ribosomal protein S27AE